MFRSLCFQNVAKSMFWHLLPALVIEGPEPQEFRMPQIGAREWLEKKQIYDEKAKSDWSQVAMMNAKAKDKRESFLEHFWETYLKDVVHM